MQYVILDYILNRKRKKDPAIKDIWGTMRELEYELYVRY